MQRFLIGQKVDLIANPSFRCIFANHFCANITSLSLRLTAPGVAAFAIGDGLAVLYLRFLHFLQYLHCFLMAQKSGLSVKTYLLRCNFAERNYAVIE